MLLSPGDRLPDPALSYTDGRTVSLASLAGEKTLIVFPRQLA